MSQKLTVEVSPGQAETDSRVPPSPGHVANRASPTVTVNRLLQIDFETLAHEVQEVVSLFTEMFKPQQNGPSKREVKFGLKVNASGTVYVASAGGEVALEVKLSWE